MFSDYHIPVMLAIIYVLFLPELPRTSNKARAFVTFVLILVGIRYLYWRTFYTVPLLDESGRTPYWMWICYGEEILGWMDSFMFFTLLSRTKNRTKEADAHEKYLRSLSIDEHPMVDVFFTIYNEPIDVLEYSVIGAKALHWPKERVKIWVLDDGNRDDVRHFCKNVDVGYITRTEHTGAKAGNINNALKYTNGDYIAIFDTDFIPHRNFLYRTVGFFKDKNIAIVQTPHGFYNQDILQNNLKLFEAVPNDQALFFESIMPSRDAWGVAFFCGTSAVLCRKKLLEVGGIPIQTVTEDVLLSLILLRKGYRTIYLQEHLSQGLATESIKDFTVQRRRWCLGNLQMMIVKNGIFAKGLTLKERIFFFPSYWLFMIFIKWITFVAPLLFLWTNIRILDATLPDLTYNQVPFVIIVIASMMWYGPWQFIPIVTNAFNIIQMIAVIPSGFRMLFSPLKAKFKVTPKVRDFKEGGYNLPALVVCATLFLFSFFGVVTNLIPQYQVVPHNGFFPIAALWTFVNTLTLGFAIMMCFEVKRHRKYDRFPVHQVMEVLINKETYDVEVLDISIGGARIKLPKNLSITKNTTIEIHLPEAGAMDAHVVFHRDQEIGLEFLNITEERRYKLIQFIMTGRFDNARPRQSVGFLAKKLAQRALGHN